MACSLGAAGTAPPGLPPSSPSPPPSPPPPWTPPGASSGPADQPWRSPGPAASEALYPQNAWHTEPDPRANSTQSLRPSLHGDDDRRILLIVYIHGFMGDTTSFRSFPAHVHNYLKEALAESHVIHSKIYPRYKTYKAINIARDNFSTWLEPHESDGTDVVLVGHSMGGLLAADVALMPSANPVYGHPFKHRILGTISLDAPLLGLHPGIIKSGIASLFRKAPEPPGKGQELADSLASQNASGSISTLSSSTDGAASSGMMASSPLTASSSASSGPDPNYNPPFFNDVQFIDRGWWKNMAHFAKKHYSEGLFTSTYHHLLSHLEFGACLADYAALNGRYNRIRRLEDVDELNTRGHGGQRQARIRFVNYYTVSTGIPKKPPTPKHTNSHRRSQSVESQRSATGSSEASTPRISIEDYNDSQRPQTLQILDPVPEPDGELEEAAVAEAVAEAAAAATPLPMEEASEEKASSSLSEEKVTTDGGPGQDGQNELASASQPHSQEVEAADDPMNDLPSIPTLPEAPQAPDLERYRDKDARKQAEKEFKRTQKTYEQAVKNREKALKERQKLVEKRRKKAQKEAEKRQKEEEKRLAKGKKEQGAGQKESGRGDAGPAARRTQVVTTAQTQALQRQLTDLASHDRPPGRSTTPSLSPQTTRASLPSQSPDMMADRAGQNPPAGGKKKLRKFCMLPQKTDGVLDSCWIQIYMDGVDEVGAHCGLFFAGPHYEKLVGDVGSRVVAWLQENMSTRAILAAH